MLGVYLSSSYGFSCICSLFRARLCWEGGGGAVVYQMQGLMVHDSVGNYVLPSDHLVLVLSDRCQFGCHGEPWAYVTAADITCSDWSPKCGASEDATDEIASWLSRGLVFEMLARTDVI